MRISDVSVSSTLTTNLSRTFQKMAQLQKELITGARINDASDDPSGATRSLNLRGQVRNIEQYQRNIQEGQGYLNITDSTLGEVIDTLMSAKSTAIQGANDTLTDRDRKILANTVDNVLEHVLHLSSTQFRGRYIFGGTQTLLRPYVETRDANGKISTIENGLTEGRPLSDATTAVGTLLSLGAPPSGTVTIGDQTVAIDLATDSLTDIKAKIDAAAPTGVTTTIASSPSGSSDTFRLVISGTTTIADSNNVLENLGIETIETSGSVLREVGDGVSVQINAAGEDIFEGQFNPFTALLNLRDSLQTNDLNGIRESITELDEARNKISDTRGVIGARTSRVELTNSLLERFTVNLKESLSNTEDTDFAQAVTDLQSRQNTFQAALSSGMTLLQSSLIDFMR
jgi:flagellar hook-associated protein 3 FlgL